MDYKEELKAAIKGFINGIKYGIKIRLPHALIMYLLFNSSNKRLNDRFIGALKPVGSAVFVHSRNLGCFAALYKICLSILKGIHFGMNKKDRLTVTTTTLTPAGIPQTLAHSLLAGFIGGYFVWGKTSSSARKSNHRNQRSRLSAYGSDSVVRMDSSSFSSLENDTTAQYLNKVNDSVNMQILLYLVPRVIHGLYKYIAATSTIQNIQKKQKSAIDRQVNSETPVIKNTRYRIVASLTWSLVMLLFEGHPEFLQSSLKRSMDAIYR